MRFDFIAGFMLITSVYGVIVSLILLLFPQKNTFNKRLLGVSLISYALFCLYMAIMYSHLIFVWPHLFRLVAPVMYLVAPASYLYVRTTINGETQFRKFDWVHFFPCLFLLIELMPFYLRGTDYKLQVIQYYQAHRAEVIYLREGFLEPHFHFIFRTIIAFIYVYFQWKVITDFLSAASHKIRVKYEVLINWLKLYSLLTTATFSLILLTSILGLYFNTLQDFINVSVSLQLLTISVILVLKPRVLYSFDEELVLVTNTEQKVADKTEKLKTVKDAIADLLQNQKHYLNKGYNLALMAEDLDIPTHVLSATINTEFHLSFRDLINKYRVEYIINSISGQKIANYTFEGIALEAGFNSRTTFYRAFIKVTGETPTTYFKRDL
ncbi:AraC family transcriptional regulator [Mucilaginibacter jinjuensis]|uniref:Helix-turn-helix domain-containing protein n=1 Tax=Mucilaginibacter jinjuensis TaxID=1176721 RepID=A0ABY7T2N4_9SPHI|nr:helix-turn-helix domain-containing protein [Mucilaginibacter jinjuensis]WCT09996.1 helix-turn-helix domain-containing protein [Mucilaginibacter jinjuensis]